MTGDPVALGQVHQAERRFADLADAAGRALEVVDGRRLDRIDDDQPRSLLPVRSRRSARRRARPGRGPAPPPARSAARAVPRGAGPGQAIPRRWRRGPCRRRRSGRDRPRPGAGAWTCRSPARHRRGRASPGTRPPPRTRSSSSIPRRRRGRSASAMPARRFRRGGRRRDRAAIARSERVGSRTTVSTSVFQPSHARHCPSQRRKDFPAGLADEAALGPRHPR